MERFCSKQSFFEVQAIRKIYCVHLCLLVCFCFLPHALILPSSGKFSGHQGTHTLLSLLLFLPLFLPRWAEEEEEGLLLVFHIEEGEKFALLTPGIDRENHQ